jgi:hypothetical protein
MKLDAAAACTPAKLFNMLRSVGISTADDNDADWKIRETDADRCLMPSGVAGPEMKYVRQMIMHGYHGLWFASARLD